MYVPTRTLTHIENFTTRNGRKSQFTLVAKGEGYAIPNNLLNALRSADRWKENVLCTCMVCSTGSN